MRVVIPVWGFIAVTVPLVVTPGASTAVVLRNSVAGGTRAGIVTAVGANAGSLCYGLLTAFGFALALQRWPSAWTVLRAAGVLYLAWLGIQSLRHATRPDAVETVATDRPSRNSWQNLCEGFVTNLLNPALATFYLVLLPQFIPRGSPIARGVLWLTAIHIALAATWHVAWALAGGTLARTLARGRPRRILDTITGVAFLALAIKVALQ
jgi:threonine/homoserine/homoserine lactone efflux protein